MERPFTHSPFPHIGRNYLLLEDGPRPRKEESIIIKLKSVGDTLDVS